MILDACRDNPLRATRSGAGGLARMDGQGTLIVFATEAGRTASDNPQGRNGLFTEHLLKAYRLHCERVKLTSMVVTTSTGLPSSRVGLYSHCWTASSAAWTNNGGPLMRSSFS